MLQSCDVFGIAQLRAGPALALLAGALACGPADLDPDGGVPAGWLSTDRSWWVMATVVAPPDGPADRAALAGAATELHVARFARDGGSLTLVTDAGVALARLPARFIAERDTVAVDWGGSDLPVELQPGWMAQPLAAPSQPFAESAAFDGHRVGPDYIEWTVPAVLEAQADALALAGRERRAHLRFSAVPARAAAPALVDEARRFRFRSDGVVPRLDLFEDPDDSWPDRRVRTVEIEAAPGLDPAAFDALAEATRRVSRALEAGLLERGAQLPALDVLRAVPSRCNPNNLSRMVVGRPALAELVRDRLCPSDPLCVVDRLQTSRVALEAACRGLAAATWDPTAGASELEWARAGDLRRHLADVAAPGSPFEVAATTGFAPDGRVVHLELRVDLDTVAAIAARVGAWTERLLSPLPDDGPRAEELLSALEWSSRDLQRALQTTPTDAFASRLQTRALAPAPPSADAQRERALDVADAAGPAWSLARFTATSTTLLRADEGSGARARLARAGIRLDGEAEIGTVNLAVRFGTAGPEEAARRVRALLERRRWLLALLLGLGLEGNPAASRDPLNLDPTHRLTASVTDALPLALATELVDLGPYDRAALRFAHAEQVLRFDHPVPDPDTIAAHVATQGPAGLIALLCRDTDCPDAAAALEVFTERSYGPIELGSDRAGEVPFASCPTEAAFTRRRLDCRWGDWGLVPAHAAAFDLALFRGEGWLHGERRAWDRALETARLAAQSLAGRADTAAAGEPNPFASPLARSEAAAVAEVLNAAEQITQRPRPGPWCRAEQGLIPCSASDGPTLTVGRGFGRSEDDASLLHAALLSLSLDDEAPGHPARLFVPELRQIAASTVRRPEGAHPQWCPDPLDRLERGFPSLRGVIDPASGAPWPTGSCRDGVPMLDSARTGPVTGALSLFVTVGAERDPTLAVRSPPAADDCVIEIDGRAYGSSRVDDPWTDLGCHTLEALADPGDLATAEALRRATDALAPR